jgi:hypothetical protein
MTVHECGSQGRDRAIRSTDIFVDYSTLRGRFLCNAQQYNTKPKICDIMGADQSSLCWVDYSEPQQLPYYRHRDMSITNNSEGSVSAASTHQALHVFSSKSQVMCV